MSRAKLSKAFGEVSKRLEELTGPIDRGGYFVGWPVRKS